MSIVDDSISYIKATMPKGQSLADKLTALTNPTPEFGTQDDEDEDKLTGAKVTEADDDEDDVGESGRSYLRTANAPNLDDSDSRYKGKKIKRKDFQKDRDFMEHSEAELGHMFDQGDDQSDDEDEAENWEDGSAEESDSEAGEGEEIEYEEEGSQSDKEETEGENDDDEDIAEQEFDMDISSFTKKEVKDTPSDSMFRVSETDSLYAKGQAVTAQLSTWDKLLEQRILLQKMATKVNTFPQNLDAFVDEDDPEHVKLVNKANKALSSLMMKSVQLKNCLERKGVEDSKAMKRSLSDMSDWLETDFEEGEPRRKERILMWNDRTQRLGSMGAMNTPALEQIEQITSNMARLVKRTQVVRVECSVLGQEREEADGQQQEDKNIFDDSDFYHHLLRELIEKKTSSSSEAGEAGKHWLHIQKLRSKLKKKVDTRASKGRKVRYDVHTKLVNFMAPLRLANQMPDKARQELFSSLFGARKA